jgi:hypothetical protein
MRRVRDGASVISKADWFRERAADCAKLAAAAVDRRAKTMLTDMVSAWLRLAEWEEKKAERRRSEEQ